jgi:hypothetical protein
MTNDAMCERCNKPVKYNPHMTQAYEGVVLSDAVRVVCVSCVERMLEKEQDWLLRCNAAALRERRAGRDCERHRM